MLCVDELAQWESQEGPDLLLPTGRHWRPQDSEPHDHGTGPLRPKDGKTGAEAVVRVLAQWPPAQVDSWPQPQKSVDSLYLMGVGVKNGVGEGEVKGLCIPNQQLCHSGFWEDYERDVSQFKMPYTITRGKQFQASYNSFLAPFLPFPSKILVIGRETDLPPVRIISFLTLSWAYTFWSEVLRMCTDLSYMCLAREVVVDVR